MPDSPADDLGDRFARVTARIDQANSADPNHEVVDGTDFPSSLVYAKRMTRWLAQIAPEASEELRIAVRAQHLERWKIPRNSYPDGRAGYLRWRSCLAERHAELVAAMMLAEDYGPDQIDKVKSLVRKRNLRVDAEAQALEDVACLVFLENHLADFAAKQPGDKMADIVAKTWRKMSPMGRKAAATLALPDAVRSLMSRVPCAYRELDSPWTD